MSRARGRHTLLHSEQYMVARRTGLTPSVHKGPNSAGNRVKLAYSGNDGASAAAGSSSIAVRGDDAN